jgi:hypothetical protein
MSLLIPPLFVLGSEAEVALNWLENRQSEGFSPPVGLLTRNALVFDRLGTLAHALPAQLRLTTSARVVCVLATSSSSCTVEEL